MFETPDISFVTGVAIVTGASAGIGEAVCEIFLLSGWEVIGISRHRGALDDVEYIEADLSCVDAIGDVKDAVAPMLNRRICLVHNAAEFKHDTARFPDDGYLDRCFRLMVVAPSVLNKFFASSLLDGSSIIYVGSTLSEMSVPNAFSYTVLKHAVIGMMRATQQDFSGASIHTCCVCPGVTSTRMINNNRAIDSDFIKSRVSFGRLIDPKEIANLIYYCSISPVLNGSILHANLGQINK